MLTPMEQERVSDFALKHDGPRSLSLSTETHLFYFCDGDWRNSPVILVNKNGNYARLMRKPDGYWKIIKTWNTLFDFAPWMDTGKGNMDPEMALAMISHGPAFGKSECLSLFPKGAFGDTRRRAVWRHKIMRISFDQPNNRFTIIPNESGPGLFAGSGKPWESAEAHAWCMATFDPPEIGLPSAVENPYERAAANENMVAALEDNPLFGSF